MAERDWVCQALSCLLLGAYRFIQQLGGKQQRDVMHFLCVCSWHYCKLYLSLDVTYHVCGHKCPVPKGATYSEAVRGGGCQLKFIQSLQSVAEGHEGHHVGLRGSWTLVEWMNI